MEIIFCTMLSLGVLTFILIKSSKHTEKSHFDIWRETCQNCQQEK